jgi:SAM-dependent methyltransferase
MSTTDVATLESSEAEEFWKTLHPFLFPEDSFRLADGEVEKILALTNFTGRTILDLACGPGRHATVLAKKGYRVTGVDCSPFLLQKAKERAASANVDVELVQEDMRRFARPEAYDLVLSMFTSFGYFDDRQDDLKVLKNIYGSLVPGGVLVMDLFGKEVLARNFQPMSQEGPIGRFGGGDGEALIESHEIYDGWNRLRNQWLLIKGDRVKTFRFDHWIYSGQELKDRLEQVGFQKIKLAGDFRGNEYGLNASRLVVVAWK